ncbi:MAG: hypothetical protein U0457_08045 [Candidatus Sericytochromatia bacterium]
MLNIKKDKLIPLFFLLFMFSCEKSTSNIFNKALPANNSKLAQENQINKLNGIFDIKKTSELVTNKCTYCHSIKPNIDSGYKAPPRNITFDSQKEIESQMDIIKKVTFIDKSMPVGKITMSDEERNIIGLFGNQTQVSNKLEIKDAPNIITRKCSYCHSSSPDKSSGYSFAPEGFSLDSTQDMINKAKSIKKETIIKRSMPINPVTMTEEEREIVKKWLDTQVSSSSNLENEDD